MSIQICNHTCCILDIFETPGRTDLSETFLDVFRSFRWLIKKYQGLNMAFRCWRDTFPSFFAGDAWQPMVVLGRYYVKIQNDCLELFGHISEALLSQKCRFYKMHL